MWDFLKKYNYGIYCISLIDRDDRYHNARREFEKVGLLEQVNFVRTYKDPKGSRIGCWKSHMQCLKDGHARKYDFVIIFEDDVIFDNTWKSYLNDIAKFLENEESWDILRWGCVFSKLLHASKSVSNIWKANSMLAHAYMASRKFMELVVEENVNPEESDLQID